MNQFFLLCFTFCYCFVFYYYSYCNFFEKLLELSRPLISESFLFIQLKLNWVFLAPKKRKLTLVPYIFWSLLANFPLFQYKSGKYRSKKAISKEITEKSSLTKNHPFTALRIICIFKWYQRICLPLWFFYLVFYHFNDFFYALYPRFLLFCDIIHCTYSFLWV